MEPQTYAQLSQIEDEHWWFQARRDLIETAIKAMNLPQPAEMLDLGCGTGGTTAMLCRYGQVTGLDRCGLAVQRARLKAPQARIVQADAASVETLFGENAFDLVTMFNVLYHRWVTDDLGLLRRVLRVLRPGGHLLLTEPAFRMLWREHDVMDHAKTRYRLGGLRRCFAEAGIEYCWGRYFNAASFPICLLLAVRHWLGGRRHPEATIVTEAAVPPRIINNCMKAYMRLEQAISKAVGLPLGVSLAMVGRKPCAAPVAAADESPALALAGDRR